MCSHRSRTASFMHEGQPAQALRLLRALVSIRQHVATVPAAASVCVSRCVSDRTHWVRRRPILERMFLLLKRTLMSFRASSPTESTDESRDRRLVALVNEARSEQEQLQIARGH